MNDLDYVKIRKASPEDASELVNIYSYYVKNTAVTFEYEVPSIDEFKDRISRTLERYPYYVAYTDREGIIGYAYAGAFNPRAAYSWCATLSIYVKKDLRKRGVGKMLYLKLEETLIKQNFVKILAIINPSDDEYTSFGSKYFHERMGFKISGLFKNVGYKFNRWYDIIYMDKQLCQPKEMMPAITEFNKLK